MDEVTAREIDWTEKWLVPRITESLNRSGENVSCAISFPENCFFLSHVCFVDLTFSKRKQDDGKPENDEILRLVMKKPPLDDLIVDRMRMTRHFHNEILFYTKFARGNSRFPDYVYGANETLKNTVIVTRNISVDGYELCPEIYDIPFDYVVATVREIGKLHAIGYAMKERELARFRTIIEEIREPRFTDDSWMREHVNLIASRPIDWLRRRDCDADFCSKIEKHLDNAYDSIMMDSYRPVEPLATLCHGDSTRNNIFFRNNGGKLEAMLFDFSTIMYTSPAIDLSTFLYLNAAADDRTRRFDEIFRSYHDSVIEYLRDSGINDLGKYSYEKMLEDYKRRAAFGYIVAVFFAPVIRNVCHGDLRSVFTNPRDSALMVRQSGGDEMTEIFADMIIELRDSGCFDHVR